MSNSLQSRHNENDGVPNHRYLHCLPNCWFRRTPKKTSKFRVTGLSAGNSPVTGEFPVQKTSNAENASNWWRHHITYDSCCLFLAFLAGTLSMEQIRGPERPHSPTPLVIYAKNMKRYTVVYISLCCLLCLLNTVSARHMFTSLSTFYTLYTSAHMVFVSQLELTVPIFISYVWQRNYCCCTLLSLSCPPYRKDIVVSCRSSPSYKWFEHDNSKCTGWIVLKFGMHIGSEIFLSPWSTSQVGLDINGISACRYRSYLLPKATVNSSCSCSLHYTSWRPSPVRWAFAGSYIYFFIISHDCI